MRGERPGQGASPAEIGLGTGGGPSLPATNGSAGRITELIDRGRACLDVRRLRLLALALYALATLLMLLLNGVMLSRDLVFLWLMVGLLAVSVADLRGWARGMIVDWLPFLAALLVYDVLRGLAGSDPLFEPHTWPQIRLDELLFGGSIPTVELQASLFDAGRLQWYDLAIWAVYLTHFFAVFLIAAWLWSSARPRFLRFRAMLLTLTGAAFVTYLLFPAVPPWLANANGDIGEVTRVVGAVWEELGVHQAASVWQPGSNLANEVAAIPSLHTAYPVLILCFFWSSGTTTRLAWLAYALAMSFTLVYAGEHYVADVLLGWIYAIGVYLLVDRLIALRAHRRGRARLG